MKNEDFIMAKDVRKEKKITQEQLVLMCPEIAKNVIEEEGALKRRLSFRGLFNLACRLIHVAIIQENRCAVVQSIIGVMANIGFEIEQVRRLLEKQINSQKDCSGCTACFELLERAQNGQPPQEVRVIESISMPEECSKYTH